MGVRALALLLLVACGGSGKTVSLRVASSTGPSNASVTIDDIFVGTLDVVSKRGVGVPPGIHHVTVEAAGFLPWDKRVEATDAPLLLDVKLTPIPD